MNPFNYRDILSEVGCGIVLGAAIVAVPIFVLTPSENLGSWIPVFFGFFGTLVGAVIGALTSFAVYSKQKFERQISDAYSVCIAVQMAFSDFIMLRRWLDDAPEKAKKEGIKPDFLWQIVEPFIAPPPAISLPTPQLAVFAEAKEYELLQNLVLLGLKHRATCEAVMAYTKYRTEMRDIMSKKIGILQPQGSKSFASFFSKEELQQLQPRFAELESLEAIGSEMPGSIDKS